MLSTRIVIIALGFISGIVIATVWDPKLPAPVLAFLVLAGLLWSIYQLFRERNWQASTRAQLAAAGLLLALPLGLWRTSHVIHPGTDSLASILGELPKNTALTLRGIIRAEPEPRSEDRGNIDLEISEIQIGEQWQAVDGAMRITLRPNDTPDYAELMHPGAYGYSLEVGIRWRPFRPVLNPGGFGYREFLQANELDAHVYPSRRAVSIRDRSKGNPFVELALQAKAHFLEVYSRCIRNPASRLSAATTLGTRQLLNDVEYRGKDIPTTFRHAGVGHVLAVSGLHVSIISVLIFALFRLCGLRPKTFTPVLIILLILFTLLAGARPSSVRATIMNATVLIAFVYLRCNLRRATAVGLAVSATFILFGKPLLLYSPGFLLSFGAVLSLVLLVTPIDRWLRRLRGWALILNLLVASGYLLLACRSWHHFLSPWTLLAIPGAVLLANLAGAWLNARYPRAWRLGLDRLPPMLRVFLSAQLAIQVGMMIPMSAWFFGQFPVGGMFINLIAIPLVGVIVQLSMLTGLVAWLPVIGFSMARAFGAATSCLNEFFLWMAYVGSEIFPFPATPQPSLGWLIAYYLFVGLILLASLRGARAQAWLYGVVRRRGRATVFTRLTAGVALALTATGLLAFRPPTAGPPQIDIYHGAGYPVVGVSLDSGKGVLINASNAAFDGLREAQSYTIDTVFLPSPIPAAGSEVLPTLAGQMEVGQAQVSVLPEPDDDYWKALGDSYIEDMAIDNRDWAVAYEDAWNGIAESAITLQPLPFAAAVDFPGLRVSALPAVPWKPKRFVSSVQARLMLLESGGFRVLVITDTTHAVLETHQEDGLLPEVDLLLLPDISFGNRRSYADVATFAITHTRPQAIIVSSISSSRLKNPIRDLVGDVPLFITAEEGAIQLRTPQPGTLRLSGHYSGRVLELGTR
ncbi:MAG: ComEC/Rec2-related protein [Rhodothermales bacterium]|jgi:ComEC/Rec2-related protein